MSTQIFYSIRLYQAWVKQLLVDKHTSAVENHGMYKKQERIVWILLTSSLLLLLLVVLLSPVASAKSFPRNQNQKFIRELETALHAIQSYYADEVEAETLFNGAMNGMFASLNDPYSLYLDDEYLRMMQDTTEGSYGGVGLYISRDHYDPENPHGRLPYVKVIAPIEDTPSWKSGLKAGDYIYAIENESAEGFSTQDVSDRLRGVLGSEVTVTILRGKNIKFDVTLTREIIEIPTVKSTVIDNEIGYLRIIEFTPYTAQNVASTLKDFITLGLGRLVIDVRSNPGGLLESVIEIADLFLSNGVVVSTKYRQKEFNQVHRAKAGKIVPRDMEIVVLINKGSASASEILTGALKDNGRATIIGETTFGKGSIQQLIQLQSDEAAIKLTTGRYYTPAGNNIDKVGITPDIVVKEPELTDEEIESLTIILQENRIGEFIDRNPNPSARVVNKLIGDLHSEGLVLSERSIRRMIKQENNSRLNSPPVVDLDYDRVLIRAVEFLRTKK